MRPTSQPGIVPCAEVAACVWDRSFVKTSSAIKCKCLHIRPCGQMQLTSCLTIALERKLLINPLRAPRIFFFEAVKVRRDNLALVALRGKVGFFKRIHSLFAPADTEEMKILQQCP